ncbi:hypothetical protein LIA77_04496 [Sarocladium implicatum]|nr:hypothetical protein LIA77_04496 [Sarocladium implicatum]
MEAVEAVYQQDGLADSKAEREERGRRKKKNERDKRPCPDCVRVCECEYECVKEGHGGDEARRTRRRRRKRVTPHADNNSNEMVPTNTTIPSHVAYFSLLTWSRGDTCLPVKSLAFFSFARLAIQTDRQADWLPACDLVQRPGADDATSTEARLICET